jgi:branched-chain amino acid transport system ATP-binding protein
MAAALVVRDLTAGYGSNQVLHGVDFEVAEGEAVGMVGLNGAGKSVTLRCVAGMLKPWGGTVRLRDRDITRLSPEKRVHLGMATVPQGRGIFPDLTVDQNLMMGGYHLSRRECRARMNEAMSRFPRLAERRQQRAGTLSGGEQAMLAVGRALIARPGLLLLDEPSAGLAPAVAKELLELFGRLNQEGVTMLLVEQNIGLALRLVNRVVLMQKGVIVRTALPDSLTDRKALLEELGAGDLYSGEAGGGTPRAPVPAGIER